MSLTVRVLRTQRQPQVFRAKPFWKQRHLATKHRLIVRRQRARMPFTLRLDSHQSRHRIGVEVVGSRWIRQFVEIGLRTQICIQQKTLSDIAMKDLRCIHSDIAQHPGDADIGLHVFFVGRRIHRDQGFVAANHAKVSAKACVRGRDFDLEVGVAEQAHQPPLELLQTRIAGLSRYSCFAR
jgi:hypothetical protein